MNSKCEALSPETPEISGDEPFLTLQEAANFLAVAPSFLYELSRPGRFEIKSFRVGKYRRFRRSDLLRWIDDQNKNQQ